MALFAPRSPPGVEMDEPPSAPLSSPPRAGGDDGPTEALTFRKRTFRAGNAAYVTWDNVHTATKVKMYFWARRASACSSAQLNIFLHTQSRPNSVGASRMM